MAIRISKAGAEISEIRVLDVDQGNLIADAMDGRVTQLPKGSLGLEPAPQES